MTRDWGPSTTAIHGKSVSRKPGDPVATPIYQSSTFLNRVGPDTDVLYTRYGNNPNQLVLAELLSRLERAAGAIFLSSGMGATALAHLAVLDPGDHLLASEWIYGGARKLFDTEFRRLGIEVTYADPANPSSWQEGIKPNTRALFLEVLTNPTMRVVDPRPVARLAHQHGALLLVDSTFTSPINIKPLTLGADIVIHSCTKYLNGHSDVIAGAVAGSTDVILRIRDLMRVWGQSIDPGSAWLLERGMKTLAVRVERHNRNAMEFARWAASHAGIRKVHYPGLPGHPDHSIAAELLDGFGGMVGIEVDEAAATPMLERLRVAAHAPSLGGVETLVSEPRYTSHAGVPAGERARQGIPDGYIRVSVGIEDVRDIIADFESAMGN